MKKILMYICIILLTTLFTACEEKIATAVVIKAKNLIEVRLRTNTEKGMEKIGNAPIDALIYYSGNLNDANYDSLRFVGTWGNQMIIPINATGGRKLVKCYYKVNPTDTPVFFLPDLAARVVHSTRGEGKDTVFMELKHVVPTDTVITDPTGYQAHFYSELRTEFDIAYDQYGANINPLTDTGLILTKIEYSGIPDPTLDWGGVNTTQYTELGVNVTPSEQLYAVTSYNGLRGDRRLPMTYNTVTGKWEFEFMYPRNAGINFRVEKASSQPLYMGIRLITELGSVSCCNIHYFPDSNGNNVWMLFQASLVNGFPTIPWPNINQLINILELIINPTSKNIPVIPNPELQNPELQIIILKKI